MSTSASNRTLRWSWRWRRSLELNWLGCLPFDVARVRDGKARSRIFIGRLKACGMHWMAQSLLDTPTSPRYGAHPPEQYSSSIHCLPRSSEKPFVERHPSIRFDLDTQVALAWKEGARGGSGGGSRGGTRGGIPGGARRGVRGGVQGGSRYTRTTPQAQCLTHGYDIICHFSL